MKFCCDLFSKSVAIFFTLCLFLSSQAFPTTDEQALRPLVVEGAIVGKPMDQSVVQVPRGVGSKEIDAPVNELGIELKNMERLEDISLERISEKWWLKPKPSRGEWQRLLHADLSQDQSLKMKVNGLWLERVTTLEAGFSHDARDLVVLENRQNPFDSSQGRVEHIGRNENQAFGKLRVSGARLEVLADFDAKNDDVHAGALLNGHRRVRQESLNGKWHGGEVEILPFIQSRQNEFISMITPLRSNTGRGWRTGSMVKWRQTSSPTEEILVSGSASAETLTRVYANHTETGFQRYDLTAVLARTTSFTLVDVKMRLATEAAKDVLKVTRPLSLSTSDQPTLEPLIWDLGIEASSPRRFQQGVVARMRRFALLPTPSQRFGDGALLMGSEELSPESGIRASVGPWLQLANMDLEISAFKEQVVNEPVVVAVSPVAARTFALGGVWAEGFEARGSATAGALKINVVYSFQTALNGSEISWQRGKAVPGRPRHMLSTGFDYFRGAWKAGMAYAYRSEDALDLSGLWQKPPHHDLGTYVGYGARDWEVRIAGAKLLAKLNGLPSAEFAGQAAPDLLEPKIEQTEIRLQCEFLM